MSTVSSAQITEDTAGAHAWDETSIVVPISAIEHYSYCPRQCALIHIDQVFDENVFTIRGRLAHERVDAGEEEQRGDVRILRSVPLWSERLGLQGKADVVELRPEGPFPVEYKVGPRRPPHADLQLCAQALCLEEMLGVAVPAGAIYSHAERRRAAVVFTPVLRQRTETIVADLRRVLLEQRLPPAPNDARCPSCSLLYTCLPQVVGEPHRLRGLQGALWRPYEPEEEDV